LVRAEWYGQNLDRCNFHVDTISQDILDVYTMLEAVEEVSPIVRLDRLICDGVICRSHIGATFVYRDAVHLSHEGSAELGRTVGFYDVVVGNLQISPCEICP
jgi:hypothetical protein